MDDTMLEKLENEQAHSKFLEELLKTLYGKGWDKLTIPEAQKHREKVEKLEDWLKVLVDNYCKHNKDEIAKEVASEIYHYIKEKEAK